MARFNVLAGESRRPAAPWSTSPGGWPRPATTPGSARRRTSSQTAVEVMNRFLGEQLLAAWRAR
jgi:hypothetical protein